MKYISSANIACGLHAGDQDTMRRTVDLALENGVAIGAHPSFNDRSNFGRTEIDLPLNEVQELIAGQIHVMREICDIRGAKLRHVKPHGALYNQSARDPHLARAIAEAVLGVDPDIILFGLSGSHSLIEAAKTNLCTAAEVFADRTYRSDGSLTPRTEPNALIESDLSAIEQALSFVRSNSVIAVSGETVQVKCDTICIHGDGEHAVSFASRIREALEKDNIEIRHSFK